jgi:hypothetical protein
MSRHARGLFAERSRQSGIRALRLAAGGWRGSRQAVGEGRVVAGSGRAVVRRGQSTVQS